MLKIWLQRKKNLLQKVTILQDRVVKMASEKASLEKSMVGLKDAESYNYALFRDAEFKMMQKTKENEGLKLRIQYLMQDIEHLKSNLKSNRRATA